MRFIAEEKMVLPEGDYSFNVLDAKERTSKKGTDMIEVKLGISSSRGKTVVFDNLMSWNIADYITATGGTVTYGAESNIEAYEMPGQSGRLHLIVETWQGDDRNKVGKYLPSTKETKAPEKPKGALHVDEDGAPDDLPF
jgi:hypothetical protein